MTTQGIEQEGGATLIAVRNGPGARLRAAREALNWSPLEVAQQLRFSTDTIILALERDEYDPTMPLVFIKGYLRSYAGLVRLDPLQIIKEFENLDIHEPVRLASDLAPGMQRKLSNFAAKSSPKGRPGLLWGSLGVFVCSMVALMYTYRDQLPALDTPAPTVSASAATPNTEEAELNAAIESARQTNASAAAATNAPAATADATPVTAPAITAPPLATTPAPTAAAATTPPATTSASTPTKTRVSSPVQVSRDDDDDDDDDFPALKPLSKNKSTPAMKPVSKNQVVGAHETMLF